MTWTGDPSIREYVLRNVVETLEGISEAAGYEITVEEVTRDERDIEDEILNEQSSLKTPLHMVLAGDETTVSAASGGLVRATLEVLDGMLILVEDRERGIKDVKRAMWADRRRGSHPTTGAALANDTRIPDIEVLEQVFYPYSLVRFRFEIDYVHLEGAP